MSRPIIHHRTAEFRELFLATRGNLQRIFDTEGDVVVLASSGTGAMEAAVACLLNPRETAVAVVAGKFGERWAELCQAYGVPCSPLCKPYGEAASPGEICEKLGQTRQPAALLLQGCETSTATSHDLEAIAARVRREFPQVLIVVDAITALGSQPVRTDAWGLDAVISGSQKSFAMSPGLAFMALSPRALERAKSNSGPRFYFDLVREAEKQREGQTAYTPAVTLIEALRAATDEILEQGLDRVVAEAETMARATRAGLEALGFRLLSSAPSNAVTAAFPPEGVSAAALSKFLENRFHLKVAGGQGDLKGKIIRIAHLGYFDLLDVFAALSAIELSLTELGRRPATGTGVAAALEASSKRETSDALAG